MRKKLLIAGLVLVGLGLVAVGAVYWISFRENTTGYEGTRGVKIPREAGFAQMIDSLKAQQILDSRRTLRWFGKATGWANQVKAGYYTFESGASNWEILDKIRKGLQTPVRATIPPGTRPEVMAAVTARDMEFGKKDMLGALRDTALARELDTDTTALFGYMLPETYSFYWLTSANEVVRTVKQHFDRFYARAEKDSLIDEMGLSKEDVVTLASIVQWETGLADERPRMAGLYLNRLQIGMALQADPTVQYAVLEKEGQKRRLLYEDYDIQHPYNTYNFAGLPPGPITNPAPSAIQAVLTPEQHDYLYVVATGNGGHVFNETLRGHNRDANRYRERMRQRRDSLRRADSGQ